MALDKRKLLKIAIGVMGGACVLLIVSNATPYWGTGPDASYGLWQVCITYFGCLSYECNGRTSEGNAQCSKLLTARAFLTIACILSGISTLLLFLRFSKGENVPPILVLLSKWLPSVSFVASLIGVATGMAYITYTGILTVHVAAIVGIIALIVSLTGAVVTALIPVGHESM